MGPTPNQPSPSETIPSPETTILLESKPSVEDTQIMLEIEGDFNSMFADVSVL
jgi:hypothetical protein